MGLGIRTTANGRQHVERPAIQAGDGIDSGA